MTRDAAFLPRVLGVCAAILVALTLGGAARAEGAARDSVPRISAVSAKPDAAAPDASTLYNAGTIALEHGAIGPSVAFLVAAARLDPRASDIRANLAQAEAASVRARGGDATDPRTFGLPALLSAREGWWLAAALLACGALLAVAGTVRATPRRIRILGATLLVLGVLASAYLHIQAWEEKSHPEAVVIVPALSVERGPGEPSRAAVLLGAGERVRLGASRGRQTEIRIGGNSIGWADREGLWKVAETPRYTAQYAKP